jgi:uncharacterized repeat protein (TIGR02543 family)
VSFGGVTLRHKGAKLGHAIGVDPTGGVVNRYSGTLSRTGLIYRAVEYRDIYPGITMRLSFEGRSIKADYIVAPGADPRAIRFRYGAAAATLEKTGDLIAGEIRQPAPIVLQDGVKLPSRYEIDEDDWVRFVISRHDPTRPLLIDPYVVTGRAYVGGALTDRISAMAVDASGFIYLAGATESTDIATPVRPRADGVEAYILKVNPANLQVMYATYLGGTADDRALAIAVDAGGSAYVAGQTGSADFPALPGFHGGSTDGFIARLNATGGLQFATFLGGSGEDAANGVAIKPDGSAWIVGETTSSSMPLFGVAYQSVNRGAQEVMLVRVASNGSMAYSGYFGGSGNDRGVAVALDSAGEVYFTGGTTSANFPAANAYRNYNAGLQDAFIAKLSADGATLRYSTYLGGSNGSSGQSETGNWIGVDSGGAALVVGTTASNNFPITGSALQPVFGGGATDAFVAKISAAGNSLLYSTFFGGSSGEEGRVGAQVADGTFYFGGDTSSPLLPGVDAIQSQGGDIDGFFVKLSSNLGSMLAFSYFGYTGTESLTGLAVTSSSIILAGSSSSPSWFPSGGFKGWYDGWVMTISETALSVQMNSTPAGVPFAVSGAGCSPASATTPATLTWNNGASCTVSFSSTQGTGDTRTLFQNWSDGATANPRTIVASAGTLSYQMQFATEHRLTRAVSPAGAGTVSASDGYYSAGSVVQLTASASAGYQLSGWSGGATGATNPVTVTMDAPKAVTANFNTLVTINNGAPVQMTVTGTGCAAGTYSTAVTLAWSPGAICSVAVPASQVSADTRWTFVKWSDGSTANPRTITAAAGAVYTIEWNTEYRLTRSVAPASSGTVSGADGFYAASSTIELTASPAAGSQFANWSGGASGSSNPISIVMNGPKAVTANFIARTASVFIDSNVSSLQFTTSGTGCNPGTYTAPASFLWVEGTVCTISTPAAQGGDVQWVFESWADGPTSNPRNITATWPSSAYTLRFGTQYRLTRSVTGQGTVSGADGFYPAGTSIQLTAAPAAGFHFTGWSGNVVSAENPLTFQLNSPSTITANFSGAPASVTISSSVSAQFTIAGSGCPAGTYTASTSVVWTAGVPCSVTAITPQGGPDTRQVFVGWADETSVNPRTITALPGAVFGMLFTPEHKLTRTASGPGTISGSDAYYSPGAMLQLTATPAAGYQFTGWGGSASGAENPLTVTMDSAKTIIANFVAAPTSVRIESNISTQFSVSGTGCPAGSYTTPATIAWTTGTSCDVAVPSTQGGPDTRQVFTRWTDGVTSNPRAIIASPGSMYTMQWTTEHRLTRSVSGQGAVSPSDGFYAAGSTIQLTATPSAGYQFTGWSGTATGSANPLAVVMDAPKTITANFTAGPATIRIESNTAVTITVSGSGCPAGAYTTPATLTWISGGTCSVTAQQPAATADVKSVFSQWADGPVSLSRTITASPGAVYTIVMSIEYRLTRLVSGSGAVSGSDGFYAAGSTVPLTATAGSGQQFNGWSGSVASSANPLNVAMDGPKTITANFGPALSSVRIETNASTQINVSGAGCPAGAYTAPATLTWTTGTNCSISIASPQGGPDTRWVFSRWSDGSVANARSITGAPGAVYTLVMAAEHRLTRAVSGPGSVNGADGFYAAGSTLQLIATPQSGYQFAGWSGSASGGANPLTVLMDSPKTITANFTAAVTAVRIEANAAAQFSVSGAGCPTGTYTAPANVVWTNGSACTVSVTTPQGGPDSRWVFTRWSDGSTANPRMIMATSGAVYTLVMAAEHRLTRTINGQGSVSGVDGFYAAGSTVQLTATAAAGYQFGGWSGSRGGMDNPVGVRMDGPVTMTAHFNPLPGAAVETLEPLVGSGGAGTFAATFSHGGGANQLYLGYMLFLPTPNVVNYVAKGSCLVEYNRISHGMRLIDDAGTGWLGPISGVVINPNAGTLTNKQCTVNVANSSASISGNTMTVRVPVTFKGAVTPVMGTFLQALDVTGAWTGMTQFGNWVPSASTPKAGPSIAGVASSTSAGSYAVYSITASHTSGASSLSMIHLLLSTGITAGNPCQAVYFPGNNTLNLINDTGAALVSAAGVTPGTAGSIANSRCAINTGLASRSVAGNNVTVTIPLNLQASTFAGTKKVYVNAFDAFGQLTHWVQAATITVP